MNGWTTALLAAGLFLVAYAILLLTRRKDKAGNDRKLGTGFALTAALVWGLAFGRLLEDFWFGLRLGLALALVLPAIGMLVKPQKRGVLSAMIFLMIAVGVGLPAVNKLWDHVADATGQNSVHAIENALSRVSGHIGESEQQLLELKQDRKAVAQELRRFGYTSLEELEKDSKALLRLNELAEIDRLQTALTDHLAMLRRKEEQLEVGLRRAKRLDGTEAAAGEDLLDIDVDQIMREIESSQLPERAATVEEHLRRREKQELLEETMQ